MVSRPSELASLDRSQSARLTTFGRKTGKPHTVTVWFVTDGDDLYLTTLKMKRDWPRNVLANGRIELAVGDGKVTGKATRIEDPAIFDHVKGLLARKYWAARIASWFGIGPEGVFRVAVES